MLYYSFFIQKIAYFVSYINIQFKILLYFLKSVLHTKYKKNYSYAKKKFICFFYFPNTPNYNFTYILPILSFFLSCIFLKNYLIRNTNFITQCNSYI